MAGLTPEQMLLIEKTAELAADRAVQKVTEQIRNERERDIVAHQYSCPIGAEFRRVKNRGWGIITGLWIVAFLIGSASKGIWARLHSMLE